MKKILLSASLLMLSTAAFAVTDGQTYEVKDGLTCENLWIIDRLHNGTEYTKYEMSGTTSPSAVTDGKYIYVATTTRTINATEGLGACIEVFDFMTGAYVKTIDLKNADGTNFTAYMGANSFGIDEYGHFWVGSLKVNIDEGAGNAEVNIVNMETGIVTSVGELPFDMNGGRIDYYDVLGDLTGVESGASILASASNTNLNIFYWRLEKGGTEWIGGWDGSYAQEVDATYPADLTEFSTSQIKCIRQMEEDGVLGMFYVDGFNTLPTLYNNDGSMSENNFGNVDVIKYDEENNPISGEIPEPTTGTVGVGDGSIMGQNMLIYSLEQGDSEAGKPAYYAHKYRSVLTIVDADFSFSSMKYLWTIPADGFGGEISARRISCYNFIEGEPDANGKQCGYLFIYKECNGMGVYRIAEEGYGSVEENFVANANITVNGDVIAVSEVAESIEVYNVAGQMVGQVENASEIAAPATGLYIVKAVVEGAPVVKKVIVK